MKSRLAEAKTCFPTTFSKGSVSGTAVLTSFCRLKQKNAFTLSGKDSGDAEPASLFSPGMNRYGLDTHFHFP